MTLVLEVFRFSNHGAQSAQVRVPADDVQSTIVSHQTTLAGCLFAEKAAWRKRFTGSAKQDSPVKNMATRGQLPAGGTGDVSNDE